MSTETMSYALSTTVDLPFAEALEATRTQLREAGFGILTEIDLAATLKAKIDVEIPPQVILGACRPPLAHAALEAEPSVGVFLPCNVVVRAADGDGTIVEAMDPGVMTSLTGNEGLASVAEDARARLQGALDGLDA
jgi:uncharacterized protein (DUF302 family)